MNAGNNNSNSNNSNDNSNSNNNTMDATPDRKATKPRLHRQQQPQDCRRHAPPKRKSMEQLLREDGRVMRVSMSQTLFLPSIGSFEDVDSRDETSTDDHADDDNNDDSDEYDATDAELRAANAMPSYRTDSSAIALTTASSSATAASTEHSMNRFKRLKPRTVALPRSANRLQFRAAASASSPSMVLSRRTPSSTAAASRDVVFGGRGGLF